MKERQASLTRRGTRAAGTVAERREAELRRTQRSLLGLGDEHSVQLAVDGC